MMEEVEICGVRIPHKVLRMRGDGGCLFYSISHGLYGTELMAREVREQIVDYVSQHWGRC